MGQRYYLDSAPGEDADAIVLEGSEAQHLIKVMRARPGDVVELFDGSGMQWQATVTEVRRNEATLALEKPVSVSRESAIGLTLGIALPKGDRQKWLISKLVELGVARVVPLVTENGVAQPVEKAMQRLRRQVIEASKQCRRNQLMEITVPQSLDEFLQNKSGPCWISHPSSAGGASEFHSIKSLQVKAGEAFVAIGPEGGFSKTEIAVAERAGWSALDLGERILRIETAAIAVAAHLLLGR